LSALGALWNDLTFCTRCLPEELGDEDRVLVIIDSRGPVLCVKCGWNLRAKVDEATLSAVRQAVPWSYHVRNYPWQEENWDRITGYPENGLYALPFSKSQKGLRRQVLQMMREAPRRSRMWKLLHRHS
jgi:hypothetical protein